MTKPAQDLHKTWQGPKNRTLTGPFRDRICFFNTSPKGSLSGPICRPLPGFVMQFPRKAPAGGGRAQPPGGPRTLGCRGASLREFQNSLKDAPRHPSFRGPPAGWVLPRAVGTSRGCEKNLLSANPPTLRPGANSLKGDFSRIRGRHRPVGGGPSRQADREN